MFLQHCPFTIFLSAIRPPAEAADSDAGGAETARPTAERTEQGDPEESQTTAEQ